MGIIRHCDLFDLGKRDPFSSDEEETIDPVSNNCTSTNDPQGSCLKPKQLALPEHNDPQGSYLNPNQLALPEDNDPQGSCLNPNKLALPEYNDPQDFCLTSDLITFSENNDPQDGENKDSFDGENCGSPSESVPPEIGLDIPIHDVSTMNSEKSNRKGKFYRSQSIKMMGKTQEEEERENKQDDEEVEEEKKEKNHNTATASGSFSKPIKLTLSENRDEFKIMDRGILCALRAGDKQSFIKKISNDGMVIQQLVDKQGNSPLHLAAALGQSHIVEHIVSEFGDLSKIRNSMLETPLHVAATSGSFSVVKFLVKYSTDISLTSALVSAKSKNGDTALHAALKGKHEDVAFYLVGAKHAESFKENDDKVSPLYLAVEAGYYKIVEKMLECSCCPSKLASMTSGKSVVHAAMRSKRKDLLSLVLNQDRRLVTSSGKEGKTCLSLGASIGFYEGVCYILSKFPASDLCYLADKDGSTPIHMAAKEGHVRIIKRFLKSCPDSIELLNDKCQNILHVAAERGMSKVVKYIIGLDKQKRMVNEQDVDGNTPLHLATKNWHPKVVSMLTWNSEVNLKTLNNGGFTALDIAEKFKEHGYILRRRLTWMALVSAGAPNGPKPILLNTSQRQIRAKRQNTEKFQDRVNTLMVTATLVATVSFAAGFTLPGGYISSAPDLGMAVLVKETAFKVFLLCDSIAMLSSMVTIMALIWAQLGDALLIQKAFQLALPLLAIALVSMSVAFMAGVSLVVSHLPWLAYFILALDSVFLLALMLIIIPYVFSCTRQGFLRHIFYFPYFLMLSVVPDDDHNNKNS